MTRFGQEAKQAEAGLYETCKKMHSHIVRLLRWTPKVGQNLAVA